VMQSQGVMDWARAGRGTRKAKLKEIKRNKAEHLKTQLNNFFKTGFCII